MDIVIFALSTLTVIFLVIAIAMPAADYVRLPLPVAICGIGLIAGIAAWWGNIDFGTQFLDSYDIWFVQSLSLDSQTLLFIFLPPLLYEMALGVNVRRLLDDAAVVVVMAVVAVLLATVFVGFSLWLVSPISLATCMLLGAAISTTDPGAVITTFREIGAPRRLLVILEGESLLNDAAALAVFGTLVALTRAQIDLSVTGVISSFFYDFVVGATIGIAFGWLATLLYRILGASAVAETTITVALAYGSYLLADRWLGASGVVAVVFAGLTTTSIGVVRMGPRNWASVQAVWRQIGFWASSIILLITSALAPSILSALGWVEALFLLVVYIAALAARALVLYALLPGLSLIGLGTPITPPQKILVLWGGVRGAVTLILAISLGEISTIDPSERKIISALVAGYVLLTLMFNAASLRFVTQYLGLNKLSAGDIALRDRIVAGTIEDVRNYVSGLAHDRAIEPEAIEEMRAAYEPQIRETIEHSEATGIPFGERLRLGLAILANQELRLVQLAFEEEAIGPRVTSQLKAIGERLADAARIGGRDVYETAALDAFSFHGGYRFASNLQRFTRVDRPLRSLLARHLMLLLEIENILRDLQRFVPNVLAPMIRDDAAGNLSNLISRRIDHVREQIAIIGRQYPKYTEAMERTLLLRAAARREMTQYRQLHDDGIVGVELFRVLTRDLAKRRRLLNTPPSLDLGLSPLGLVDHVAIFASLSDTQKQTIARHLKVQFAMPGDVIVSTGERGNSLYFIASGVLEVRGLDKPVTLSNGDFFGELALLAPTRKRQTSIAAASYCRLLTLSRRDFRKLTEADPAIEETIRAAAERQLGEGFRAVK